MLGAIFDILEGKSSEPVIDALYLRIELLQKDLENDDDAMNWFNLLGPALPAPLTPPLRPTPLAGQ